MTNNTPNRLINEKSPYLLQHAYNPVDWYPWGSEAFRKAGEENKPVLLSIGYSACHWCHEMAEGSFADRATAETINKYFVPVKVDKEERPDIDLVYMNVCRTLTGQGGWPLNLILTPSKKPFFAGTYYPKEDTGKYVGFKTVLANAAESWSRDRESIIDTAGKITELLNKSSLPQSGEVAPNITETCADILVEGFDSKYGGFGEAPKFPSPQIILFLIQHGRLHSNANAREAALVTLRKIYEGGLHDHVGGGYFRYCTDEKWMVPHFEKMLYDNALLALCFLEAGDAFSDKATDLLRFMMDELRTPDGGFYTSISAVSRDGEGAFYLWNRKEIESVLGKDSERFFKTYNIGSRGYFKNKSLPRLTGEPYKDAEKDLQKLYVTRLSRPAPDVDKTVQAGMTALAAAVFARAYKYTRNDEYLNVAVKAAEYVDLKMRDGHGRLVASHVDGVGNVPAFSEDYVYLLWAFMELYEAGQAKYIEKAQNVWLDITKYFLREEGGVYFYASDSEQLIVRPVEGYDMSTPSANSVALYCLKKLYKALGDEGYKRDYDKILYAFGGDINEMPTGFCFMLYAMES